MYFLGDLSIFFHFTLNKRVLVMLIRFIEMNVFYIFKLVYFNIRSHGENLNILLLSSYLGKLMDGWGRVVCVKLRRFYKAIYGFIWH